MTGPGAPRLALVDYGAGNLRSIGRALQRAGAQVSVIQKPPASDRFDGIVLPGVGAFGAAMRRLTKAGLATWVRDEAHRATPLLGVCLGMQLLYARSEESPGVTGLDLLAGEVRRLPDGLKVPHMGWNRLQVWAVDDLVDASMHGAFAYFVHSYAVEPLTWDDVAASATYGITFPAVVRRHRVVGVQFHPEKSAGLGLRLLARFVAWVGAQLRAAT